MDLKAIFLPPLMMLLNNSSLKIVVLPVPVVPLIEKCKFSAYVGMGILATVNWLTPLSRVLSASVLARTSSITDKMLFESFRL